MFARFGAYASVAYSLFLYALLCILWFIVFITIYVIVKNYLKNTFIDSILTNPFPLWSKIKNQILRSQLLFIFKITFNDNKYSYKNNKPQNTQKSIQKQ